MRKMIKFLAVMFLAWGVSSVSATAEELGPKEVVEHAVNGIVDVLKERANPEVLTEVDRQAIREQVEGRFDYHEMARRSVGRIWNKQSTPLQDDFTSVFRDLLEYTYGNRLSAYKNQTVEFDDAEFKRNKARVKTNVVDGSKKTPVWYRLHQKDHHWMVYDIKIEGVSLVGTFRKDFKSSLHRDGFESLLNALKEKVSKMKAKDAA